MHVMHEIIKDRVEQQLSQDHLSFVSVRSEILTGEVLTEWVPFDYESGKLVYARKRSLRSPVLL